MCGVACILNLSGDNLDKSRIKIMIDEKDFKRNILNSSMCSQNVI